jgi:lipopolysaccharide transport system ATP-binding protein
MGEIAIKVENVAKLYQIGLKKSSSFRDSFRGIFSKNGSDHTDFWALQDISFEIKKGEAVGLIGKNGAGKSTLLKILSRITEPTKGRIEINGRVASLLEVGTGFHHELTGRENIYMNGTILGMSRREVKAKFDEIVEFSGIEKFIDTQVKHYSSGMYVRLAFAVAAHLEPEILIIDEVLAVGDAEFQKKCLGKMEEVTRNQGRTILFVSHQLNSVVELCKSAMILEKGKVIKAGNDVMGIVNLYLRPESGSGKNVIWEENEHSIQNPFFFPQKLMICDSNGQLINSIIQNNQDYWVHLEGIVEREDPALGIGYALYNEDGVLVYWTVHTDKWDLGNNTKIKIGKNKLKVKIPRRFLNEGSYRLEILAGIQNRDWIIEPGFNAPFILFEIKAGLSESPYWMNKRPGVLGPEFEWFVN